MKLIIIIIIAMVFMLVTTLMKTFLASALSSSSPNLTIMDLLMIFVIVQVFFVGFFAFTILK